MRVSFFFSSLALSFCAVAATAIPSSIMSASASSSPVILFTPGAWHGPWAFETIRKELEGRGFTTAAVTLPTVGSENVTFGVAEDTAAVRGEIEKLTSKGHEVVVVAHSYGGVPSSNAVQGLGVHDLEACGKKGGVATVVYMTSFAIPAGTSLVDGVGGVYPPWWNVSSGFVSPLTPIDIFYGDVDPAVAAASAARLKPMPLNIATDKSGFEPWNQGFPVAYIFAENDQAIPLAGQQGMASQFPAGSFTASLASSHSPFLSMPKELGDIIEKIATSI